MFLKSAQSTWDDETEFWLMDQWVEEVAFLIFENPTRLQIRLAYNKWRRRAIARLQIEGDQRDEQNLQVVLEATGRTLGEFERNVRVYQKDLIRELERCA